MGALPKARIRLNRLAHSQLYWATPAANPISLDAARAAIAQGIANDSELKDVEARELVTRPGDSYQFYLYDKDDEYVGLGFVDPGTGAYLGRYDPQTTVWGWF